MRGRSLLALGFCVFTLPAVLYLPSAGWPLALGASLLAGAFLALLIRLRRRLGCAPLALAAGAPWGRMALRGTYLWNELLLGITAGHLCAAYPQGQAYPLMGLLLLLLAAWAGSRRCMGTAGAVLFYFLGPLWAMILLLALGETGAAPGPLPPLPHWGLLTAVLSPVPVLLLAEENTTPDPAAPWLLGAVAAAGLCAYTAAPWAADPFPFYRMTQTISFLGILQRFEPLVSAGLTAGGFCLLGVLARVNVKITGLLGRQGEKETAPAVCFLGALPGLLAPKGLGDTLTALGTTIFWGLIPFCILIVPFWKNLKKSEKSS